MSNGSAILAPSVTPPLQIRIARPRSKPVSRTDLSCQRMNNRKPGWSPTTVICPLQGEVSSNRNTLPGRSFLVSPSVTVMEKMPCKTIPNCVAGVGWLRRFSRSWAPQRASNPPKKAREAGKSLPIWTRRRRGREIRRAKLGRYVLKVRAPVRAAIEPCVSETGRIRGFLAARGGDMPRQSGYGDNKHQRLGLPFHRSIPLDPDRRPGQSPPWLERNKHWRGRRPASPPSTSLLARCHRTPVIGSGGLEHGSFSAIRL